MKIRSPWGVVPHPRLRHLGFMQWLEVLLLFARKNLPPHLPAHILGFTPSLHRPRTDLLGKWSSIELLSPIARGGLVQVPGHGVFAIRHF